jgi:hypothetical protein
MRSKEIALVSFRVMSIFAFVLATDKASRLFNAIALDAFMDDDYFVLIQYAGPVFLLIACGTILWFLSPILSSKLVNGSREDNADSVHTADLQAILFTCTGMFIFADSFHIISQVIAIQYYADVFQTPAAHKNSLLVGSIVKSVIGIFLIFGSSGISKIVCSLRRA